MQTALRGRDGALNQPFPDIPDILQTQHRLGNGRRVGLNLPQIYVKNASCLSFSVYMQNSHESGILVNSSSGKEWWVLADQTRTWREVSEF